MPRYTYRNPRTGATLELSRSIAERDQPVHDADGSLMERAAVELPGLVVGVRGMQTQAERVLGGYYRLECEQGSRFRSGYSKTTIKNTWDRAARTGRETVIR